MKKYAAWSCLSLTLFVTACGGGGGGGSETLSQTPILDPVLITGSNFERVAIVATTGSISAGQVGEQQAVLAPSLLLGVGLSVPTAQKVSLANQAMSLANFVTKNWGDFNPSLSLGVVTNISESCSSGGSFTGTATLSGSDIPAAGDRVSASFFNCNEEGQTFNGQIVLELLEYSGQPFDDLNPFGSIVFSIETPGFSSDGQSFGGRIELGIRSLAAGFEVSMRMPSVTFSDGLETYSFSGFSLVISESQELATLAMSGIFSSSELGGSIEFNTLQRVSILPNGIVTQGDLRITGANGTQIRLAGNGTAVLILQADTNGDNIFDIDTFLQSSELFG